MSDTIGPDLDAGTESRLFKFTNFGRKRTKGIEGRTEEGIASGGSGSGGPEAVAVVPLPISAALTSSAPEVAAVSTAVSSPISGRVVRRRGNRPLAEVMGELEKLRLGERTDITSGETIPADTGATLATETNYVREVVPLLAEALQHPNELKDSTWKTQAIGVLSEVLKISSTIAVNSATARVLQQVGTESFDNRLVGKATYLGTSLLLNTVSPDAVSWVTRKLGGVETKIYATLDPKRSNVGSYNEIAGKTALTMAQTWLYGTISSILYEVLPLEGVDRTAAATVPAALIAAGGAQAVNAYLNYRTLKDQGVDSHSDLRAQRHNHDPNVGRVTALNYAIPAVTDRTTPGEKAKEVGLRAAVAALQQGTLFALQAGNPFDPGKDPAKYQAYTVFVGFTGGLCMQALGNAASARLYTDPARHRQRYMTIANEIRCQQLRDSSLNLRTACLNEVANNLSGKMPAQDFFASDAASKEHEEMRSLFGSASRLMHADAPTNFTSKGDIKDVQALKDFFEKQKSVYEGAASSVGDASKGSITSAREILDFIVKDLNHLEETFKVKDDGQAVGPSFTDMVQRTRELSMLLFQSDFLEGKSDPVTERDVTLTEALTPVLAGLRHADRRAHATASLDTIRGIQKMAFDKGEKVDLVEEVSSRFTALFQDTPQTKLVRSLTDSLDGLGSFNGPGSGFGKKHYEFLRIFGTDLTGAIDEALTHIAPDHQADYLARICEGVKTARTVAQNNEVGSPAAQSALCALEGQLRQKSDSSLPQERALENAILRFGNSEDAALAMPGGYPPVSDKNPLKALMSDVAAGIIDFSTFSRFLSRPESLDGEDLGIREPRPGRLRDAIGYELNTLGKRGQITEAVNTMKSTVSGDVLKALQGDKSPMSTPADTARRMLDCQAQDISDMQHMVRPLLEVGLLLGRVDGAHKLVIEHQKDAHLHPDNFNKLRVTLDVLFDLQKASGILASAIMSIPFNIQNPRSEVVYYGNNYGNSWHHNPNEELLKKQVVAPNLIATTAINLQEPEKIEADIRLALQNDPEDVIKAIGEITLVKLGGITDAAKIDIIEIEKVASKLLVPAARMGYPLTIHHDFGKDHGDFELGKKLMDAIKSARKTLEEGVDPLAAGASYGETPKAKLRVCVPHLGMSPQNSGGPKLSAFWKKCLEDKDLRDTLNGDLSWSFTTKYITSDIRDQVRGFSPEIALGLDAWATAYSAFQVQGGTADKLTDLTKHGKPAKLAKPGDLSDEAAQHKNASDGIADFYARTVAFVDAVVKKEMNDPVKAQKVLDLIHEHGDAGNNWLYILGKHSDRLMFGTDNLASGIKIHGEAEHMLDALALHPIYSIFRALSRAAEPDGEGKVPPRDLALADVVPNLARDVWDDFFLDKECSDRRKAMRDFVNKVKPTDTRRALGNVVSYIDRIDPDEDPSDIVKDMIAKANGGVGGGGSGDFPGAKALTPLVVGLQTALRNARPDPDPKKSDPIELMIYNLFAETTLDPAKSARAGDTIDAKSLSNTMVTELLIRLEKDGKADELVGRLKQTKWSKSRIDVFEEMLATLRGSAGTSGSATV